MYIFLVPPNTLSSAIFCKQKLSLVKIQRNVFELLYGIKVSTNFNLMQSTRNAGEGSYFEMQKHSFTIRHLKINLNVIVDHKCVASIY